MAVWVGGALVLAVIAGWYLRRSRTLAVGPTYVYGVSALTLGAVGGDLSRLLFHAEPLVGLLASMLAVTGICAVTVATYPTWREMLCDAWLLGGCVLLIVVDVAAVVIPVPTSDALTADVLALGGVVYVCVFVIDFALALTAVPVARLLFAAWGALRVVIWTLSCAESAGLHAIGPVAAVLCVIAYLCLIGFALVLGMKRIPPQSMETSGRPTLVPYSSAVLAMAVTGWLLVFHPDLVQPYIPVFSFVFGVVIVLRQKVTMTSLRRVTEEAREREAYFRALVRDSHDVIMISGDDGVLHDVSPAALKVLGPDAEGLTGTALAEVLGVTPAQVGRVLRRARAGESARIEGRRLDKALEAVVSYSDGRFVVSVRDVSERDRLQRKLHRLAFQDPLTGLANRPKVITDIDRRLSAGLYRPFSVIFIDLDRFKPINDVAGHEVGDLVLRQVAQRLQRTIPPGSLLARLGGDEFIAIIEGELEAGVAASTAVVEAMKDRFVAAGSAYQLGASVGIATADAHSSSEELLRRADLAMYEAKRDSRMHWAIYTPALSRLAAAKLIEQGEVAAAWNRDAVNVYLQPIVATRDQRPISVEALLRWRDADGRMRSPEAMLAYATRTGGLGTLSDWVLHQVLQVMQVSDLRLAVNMPPTLLTSDAVVAELLLKPLAAHGISPDRLSLEITEDAVVEEGDSVLEAFHRLREHGFRLYVDDFGTGYSSLSYLVRLPLDGVKLDRSFVTQLPHSDQARSVVKGIVQLCRELDIELIAEGVESREHHEWLCRLGVTLAQGFWYAEPRDWREASRVLTGP